MGIFLSRTINFYITSKESDCELVLEELRNIINKISDEFLLDKNNIILEIQPFDKFQETYTFTDVNKDSWYIKILGRPGFAQKVVEIPYSVDTLSLVANIQNMLIGTRDMTGLSLTRELYSIEYEKTMGVSEDKDIIVRHPIIKKSIVSIFDTSYPSLLDNEEAYRFKPPMNPKPLYYNTIEEALRQTIMICDIQLEDIRYKHRFVDSGLVLERDIYTETLKTLCCRNIEDIIN